MRTKTVWIQTWPQPWALLASVEAADPSPQALRAGLCSIGGIGRVCCAVPANRQPFGACKSEGLCKYLSSSSHSGLSASSTAATSTEHELWKLCILLALAGWLARCVITILEVQACFARGRCDLALPGGFFIACHSCIDL